jgi:hypothetical protein
MATDIEIDLSSWKLGNIINHDIKIDKILITPYLLYRVWPKILRSLNLWLCLIDFVVFVFLLLLIQPSELHVNAGFDHL